MAKVLNQRGGGRKWGLLKTLCKEGEAREIIQETPTQSPLLR